MKRFLTVFLLLVLVISLFPLSANAFSYPLSNDLDKIDKFNELMLVNKVKISIQDYREGYRSSDIISAAKGLLKSYDNCFVSTSKDDSMRYLMHYIFYSGYNPVCNWIGFSEVNSNGKRGEERKIISSFIQAITDTQEESANALFDFMLQNINITKNEIVTGQSLVEFNRFIFHLSVGSTYADTNFFIYSKDAKLTDTSNIIKNPNLSQFIKSNQTNTVPSKPKEIPGTIVYNELKKLNLFSEYCLNDDVIFSDPTQNIGSVETHPDFGKIITSQTDIAKGVECSYIYTISKNNVTAYNMNIDLSQAFSQRTYYILLKNYIKAQLSISEKESLLIVDYLLENLSLPDDITPLTLISQSSSQSQQSSISKFNHNILLEAVTQSDGHIRLNLALSPIKLAKEPKKEPAESSMGSFYDKNKSIEIEFYFTYPQYITKAVLEKYPMLKSRYDEHMKDK